MAPWGWHMREVFSPFFFRYLLTALLVTSAVYLLTSPWIVTVDILPWEAHDTASVLD
jgi:hypothetical protein